MVVYWGVLGLATSPAFLLGRKVLFKDWADFFDAVGYWLKPDIFSLFQGDFIEDLWAEFRLFLLLALTFACGFFLHLKFGPPVRSWLTSVGLG